MLLPGDLIQNYELAFLPHTQDSLTWFSTLTSPEFQDAEPAASFPQMPNRHNQTQRVQNRTSESTDSLSTPSQSRAPTCNVQAPNLGILDSFLFGTAPLSLLIALKNSTFPIQRAHTGSDRVSALTSLPLGPDHRVLLPPLNCVTDRSSCFQTILQMQSKLGHCTRVLRSWRRPPLRLESNLNTAGNKAGSELLAASRGLHPSMLLTHAAHRP